MKKMTFLRKLPGGQAKQENCRFRFNVTIQEVQVPSPR
jgi:hypothetical protein